MWCCIFKLKSLLAKHFLETYNIYLYTSIYIVWFHQSYNTGAIDAEMDGSVLKEK